MNNTMSDNIIKSSKQITLNTVITTLGIALCGFIGKETYKEIRETHDAVLQMVPRQQFDIQMTEIRTRLSYVEAEIIKIRNDKRNP